MTGFLEWVSEVIVRRIFSEAYGSNTWAEESRDRIIGESKSDWLEGLDGIKFFPE